MSWTIPTSAGNAIFQGDSVRAILKGRKRMTQRVIFPQPDPSTSGGFRVYEDNTRTFFTWAPTKEVVQATLLEHHLPSKWRTGSIIYIREALEVTNEPALRYKADDREFAVEDTAWFEDKLDRGKYGISPLFAPKWSCRLVIQVRESEAVRLHDMEEAMAVLEGVEDSGDPKVNLAEFSQRWDEINAARGYPWVNDPWVWRIQFEVLQSRNFTEAP